MSVPTDPSPRATNSPSFTETLVAAMPFASRLGLIVDSAQPEEVRARLPWAPDLCTAGGILHGGALMAAADAAGGYCAALNLPSGAGTATVESKTNMLRPVREGEVTVVSTPVHVGSRFIVVKTELHHSSGKLVALTIQTQAVLSS